MKDKVPVSESARVSYASYLKIPELLSAQVPLAKPFVEEELLFILSHQVYELWFKQVLSDLNSAIKKLDAGDIFSTLRNLDRTNKIFRSLLSTLDILETMSAAEFNRFRSYLDPASGFQSAQFREIETVGGYETTERPAPHQSLRKAFFRFLKQTFNLSSIDQASIQQAIDTVYSESNHELARALCETLIELDEILENWRFRHAQMAERMIGFKMGTGGSLGVPYLRSTIGKRFFPELWAARTRMT